MKKSIRIALMLFISVAFMTSCCDEGTYQITITGLESEILEKDGNTLSPFDLQNTIAKEDFVISVRFEENEVLISKNSFQKKKSDAEVLNAAVVPCGDATFVYTNKIQSVKVEILDSNNGNARIDITDQLKIFGSNESLTDYVAENKDWLRDFLIDFSDTSNIPNRIEYDVQITLDDGLVVSSAGGIINFN